MTDYNKLWTYSCDTPNYQRLNKPSAWVRVENAPKKMFLSYPFFQWMPVEGEKQPKRYGSFVIDIDTKEDACGAALSIIQYFLEVYSLEKAAWRIFLSGKKGIHLELSDSELGTQSGHVYLTAGYKSLAKEVSEALDVTLDMSMYCGSTGKPYRQPNIMRSRGTCKRQVTWDQLQEMVGLKNLDSYCSNPGGLWIPDFFSNEGLALKMEGYLTEAEKHEEELANAPEMAPEELQALRGSMPPCIQFLRNAVTPGAKGSTFNECAMQITAYGTTCGMPEANFLKIFEGFIQGYPSSSLTTPEKRRRNCVDRYRVMQRGKHKFSCGGIRSLGFAFWDFDCSECSWPGKTESKAKVDPLDLLESVEGGSGAEVLEPENEAEEENFSLEIPDSLLNPGGLISLGMKGMSAPGLPKIKQFDYATVLSVLARAITGKMQVHNFHPIFYFVKTGRTSIGKSESSKAMVRVINRVFKKEGVHDFFGPNKIASGPSLLRSFTKRPNVLSIFDEAKFLFKRYGAEDQGQAGLIEELLSLHAETGEPLYKAYASAKDTIEVEKAFFSFLGSTTTDAAYSSLQPEDFKSGFVQRIDFWHYDGLAPYRDSSQDSQNHLEQFALGLKQLVDLRPTVNMDDPTNTIASVQMTPEAEERRAEWSIQVIKDGNAVKDDPGEIGVLGRRYEFSLKYALLFKVSRNIGKYPFEEFQRDGGMAAFGPLELEDLEKGIELSNILARWKLDKLRSLMTYGEIDEKCKLFREAWVVANRAKKNPTFGFMKNRKPALRGWDDNDIQRVVRTLESRGEVEVIKGRRGTEKYFLK